MANTFGFGGMTNHIGDMMFSKYIFIIGANPAVNHPVSMVHILRAKEAGAKIVVVDPRFTKTGAKADEYYRIRSGTDIALIYGMLNHIIKNNLYDKKFLEDRVYGYEEIIKEAMRYTLEEASDITGIPVKDIIHIAEEMAAAKPASLIWNQGLTQHTTGTSNTRIMPILQMFLGNMGKNGGGVNILRGHDNVQGSSDMAANPDVLPGYYNLSETSWRHFAKHWYVEYDWLLSRFKDKKMMETKGYAHSTWKFGVLDEENFQNNGGTKLRALVVIGSGMTSVSLLDLQKKAMDKLDLVVFVDPYVNDLAIYSERDNNLFVLPAASQMESSGSVAATNRSYQWRSKVMEPLFECKEDQEVLFELAKRLGFLEQFQRSLYENAKKEGRSEFIWPEDATTELTQSVRSIGLQGMSYKRLKAHQENWHMFDKVTLEGKGPFKGEYYGLPWPCWSDKHPGTPVFYNDSIPVMRGGMGFRVNWGDVSPDGQSMLSPHRLPNASVAGHSPISAANAESLGIKLTKEEQKQVEGTTYALGFGNNILVERALEAGLCPYGNGKARAVVWNWYDKIPLHREPIHSVRGDLVNKYPNFPDKPNHYRANIKYRSRQIEKNWVSEFPINMLSGRLVAHMGTGTETRSAKYLAEVEGEMFVEIHPDKAYELGINDGDMVWVYGTMGTRALIKAKLSYRVDANSIWMPQNFSGLEQGKNLLDKYPQGTAPYAIGESANMISSYGYDYNTACPETKCGLCRIEKA
ncbi:formate dehydrogenase [Helicobacter apodemus]|uniref:Formate dehydrogenase n=1 Tax=Helicobacter apodemus TaxID=135569 RepID=A0A4U8UF81_9HELI|nr:formate dehydrogenase [Helicobacter apodemus]